MWCVRWLPSHRLTVVDLRGHPCLVLIFRVQVQLQVQALWEVEVVEEVDFDGVDLLKPW